MGINMTTGYCTHCQTTVTLTKKDIDACLLCLLFFTGIGWIIYLIIYAMEPEDRCVMCGNRANFLPPQQIAPTPASLPTPAAPITPTPTQTYRTYSEPAQTSRPMPVPGSAQALPTKRYCQYCGSELAPNARFCAGCGTQLDG
jgi:hypothetical protein